MVIPVNFSEEQTAEEAKALYLKTIQIFVDRFGKFIPQEVQQSINACPTDEQKLLGRYRYLRDAKIVSIKDADALEKIYQRAFPAQKN